jgi:hypothetical protein
MRDLGLAAGAPIGIMAEGPTEAAGPLTVVTSAPVKPERGR